MTIADSGSAQPDADLVAGARAGNQMAFDKLFDRWFDKVWNISKSIVNDDAIATTITQATFLAAWRQLHRIQEPSTFGGWTLLTARQKSLAALDDESIETTRPEIPRGEPKSESASQEQLLLAVTKTFGEEEASLIDLRLRYELSTSELAHELDLSGKEVQKRIGQGTNLLIEAIRNFSLWNYGEPECQKLVLLIEGSETYEPSTIRTIKGHIIGCGDCKTYRSRVNRPVELFSSIPLSEAPDNAKADVISALADDGLSISTGTQTPAGSQASTGTQTSAAIATPATPPEAALLDELPESTSTNAELDLAATASGEPEEPKTADAVADRFPAKTDSSITERFQVVEVDASSDFAQDSPVRYSQRPPRVIPAEKTRRFAPSKTVLILAASLLFVVAGLAIIFTSNRSDTVSANAGPIPSTTSSPTTNKAAAAQEPASPNVTDNAEVTADKSTTTARRTTTTARRTTTAAPTTTVQPTTTAMPTTTQPTQVLIPDLTNSPANEAVETLNNLGLETQTRPILTLNRRNVGLVASVTPGAGQSVEIGSSVVVRVYTSLSLG